MISHIGCVIIMTAKRRRLVEEKVLPSVLAEPFHDIVVVGDDPPVGPDFFTVEVPTILGTTTDALIKRDVGTLVLSHCDVFVYLCDDHAVLPGFVDGTRRLLPDTVDIVVPARYADHPEQGRIRIPNGEEARYCGGHCGIFRRRVITRWPWTSQTHDRLWDLLSSQRFLALNYAMRWTPGNSPGVLDLEPEHEPWQ